MELIELLRRLNAVHGPSGDEGEIQDVIVQLAQPYADEIIRDVMGNVMVHKKGEGPRIMFAAHMDSIGFIVTHIEKDGFLRVGKVGGIHPADVQYTPVRFKSGLRGVLVPEEKADQDKLTLEDCYIDIGAKDEVQARSMVMVGDTAVYDTCTVEVNGRVISPYLDDRIACAILLKALEQVGESQNDLYFVFTVQEEVGTRGAKTAAWQADPQYGIAVDVTSVGDTPGSKGSGTSALGKGAAVKVMDTSVICHPQVVQALEKAAREGNIPTQRDIIRAGGTDAGPIHTTRTGVRTGGISIPCRYIHSPAEMADMGDIQACVDLTVAFARAELEA